MFTVHCLLAVAILGAAGEKNEPVVHWDFGSEASMPLKLHGNVHRDQAGPRAPEFPEFAKDNTALKFEAAGYLSTEDPGEESDFDFDNGDEITLEAWVRVDKARPGQQMYLIGKGRTGSAKFARDNQNWAMRVVAVDNVMKVSFLFATKRDPSKASSQWHRWISKQGFAVSSGWHHIAVAYKFGDPKSIQGWVDGKPTTGVWDMGGATKEKPIVDDDAIWIGSSQGGNPGNSFYGWLDEVAVHRTMLSNEVIASRFVRLGGPRVIGPLPETMPELTDIPQGRVLVTFGEGLPTNSRWLNEGESWPKENARWLGSAFLLPRIPIRYDSWGIRASWDAPVLVRMAADVELPAGKHRFLLRARSLSRLWIDGEVVARTRKNPHGGGNLQPIVPIPEPLVPGARLLKYPQQESFVEYEIDEPKAGGPRTSRVVLEYVVGGKNHRTESGEVSVSVQLQGANTIQVLRPVGLSPLPLEDESIEPVIAEIEDSLTLLDDQTRRQAGESQSEYWNRRHGLARDWLKKHHLQTEANDRNKPTSIDEFITRKIADATAKSASFDPKTTKHFHEEVLPILRENCFRCHGEKEKGGLKLDTREHALLAGESELPAITPGDPDKSELLVRVRDGDMPPTKDGLKPDQIATLEKWVKDGAVWPAPPIQPEQVALAPIVDDPTFLRRAYLDGVGAPPTADEAKAFLTSTSPDKRAELIDQLLQDNRYADHWTSFWLDLLAENPTLLNSSLNSTGPFRWFIYESLRDRKPFDQMATELILMRGSKHDGGSAGFAIAGENDSPMAAKGHIVASAFLGVELQCARCHDSPYHSTTQEDLYSVAAMLNRKQLTPPKTSRVPDAFFANKERESLIRVTLKPGQQVQPKWPFASFTGVEDGPHIDVLMNQPKDTRERLAALVTGPENERFPRVIVNHLWKRLMGAGIVEPVNDWEGKSVSHPELLDWLAEELVAHDYDLLHIQRLIMNSQAYQRQAVGNNLLADASQRFFPAPDRRRLTAEQIVDSLFTSTGREMNAEELTFVHDGVHPMSRRLTLGTPKRAWMFASLNNERDRPSLSLPRAQPIVDVLTAFGWTGSRQKPIAHRESDPSVLQPGVLANGDLTMSLTRAANQSALADLAVNADSPAELLDTLFLRFLARHPNQEEKAKFQSALADGFANRLTPADEIKPVLPDAPFPQVTWSNHLVGEANSIQTQVQARVRRGPLPDPRLRTEWREVYEDVVWSLINHREFVWVP